MTCNPHKIGEGNFLIDKITRLSRRGYMPDNWGAKDAKTMYHGTIKDGLESMERYYSIPPVGTAWERYRRCLMVQNLRDGLDPNEGIENGTS